jgi:hydroxymethylglutaryl-CoA reductase
MVTEESSVVAAASAAARFWADKGGFQAEVKGSLKTGQIHFCWHGKPEILKRSIDPLKQFLLDGCSHITRKMTDRGGGIHGIELIDLTRKLENYYQLVVSFDTVDSMGANFINSVLEEMASGLKIFFRDHGTPGESEDSIEVIMSILSNYNTGCIVECHVETDYTSFDTIAGEKSGKEFARKFKMAVDIACLDPYRAVTHNKGIFNGIDAVILATANDFRAVEAAGHAYASRAGRYSSLSKAELNGNKFYFGIELPMAVGTVGGLTRLHPMAKWSFEILNNPNARELMMIIASAGLASNFSAIRALITRGIQQGHMKMHLVNILSSLGASEDDKTSAFEHFREKKVSYHEVELFLIERKKIE